MDNPVSISLIVPVYEEEYDVVPNIDALAIKLNELGVDYELLVFLSAKRYATFPRFLVANKRIKFFYHCDHTELGGIFRRGIKLAEKKHVGIMPPYNQITLESVKDILKTLKNYDMVVAYIKNHGARPWYRAAASLTNTWLINLLFGLRLRYYHFNFYKTALVQRVIFTTDSHAAMVEASVWMAKSGVSLIQVPFTMIPHNFESKSKALKTKNIINKA